MLSVKYQGWQAHAAPQPPDGAGASADLAGAAVVSLGAAAPSAAAVGAAAAVELALPPLKSVAYQPEPLSWKPAAVNCLLKLAWPQLGHSDNKGSEIFCNTSLANPQDSHL